MLEIGRDSRALLGRAAILREGIGVAEGGDYRPAVEQLQLVALGEESAFLVRRQFLVPPGEDLLTWRENQEMLYSLRFVDVRDASFSPTGP